MTDLVLGEIEMKKPDKESVKITNIKGANFCQFTKVEMIISRGKLMALQFALSQYKNDSAVGYDLWAMLTKAGEEK